ncbi:GNAT family N-acetyltransferase [Sediminicola sp. 1XM1-17]|uniref:GNAT family N-acetyltransferase n=1 Tax=Sediminicola sp. 1XM1-17 TaxID=3127702 RepID=UPI0030770C05
MKDFTCRKATIDDLETLLGFEQGIIVAERPFDPTIKQDPVHYYDLKEYILSDDIEVVVVEIHGVVIASGYALIKQARPYLDHKEYAYLGFMYTAPEYRGQGVNQLIIEVLKKWASAKGMTEIRLTVYDDNIPAIKAYERVGFKKHIIEMRLNTHKS